MLKTFSEYRQALINLLIDEGTEPALAIRSADLFMQYHRQNPKIWIEFEKRALAKISQGATRLGSKKIFEDMREESNLPQAAGQYKVCNTFTAYYPRMFGLKHPQLKNFFKYRDVSGICSEQPSLF